MNIVDPAFIFLFGGAGIYLGAFRGSAVIVLGEVTLELGFSRFPVLGWDMGSFLKYGDPNIDAKILYSFLQRHQQWYPNFGKPL